MLYVAIGSKIKNKNMPLDMWEEFQSDVEAVISSSEGLSGADTKAFGESHYDYVPETTCVFVWFDKVSPLMTMTERALESVARKYGQESIAYSVSETLFVDGVK